MGVEFVFSSRVSLYLQTVVYIVRRFIWNQFGYGDLVTGTYPRVCSGGANYKIIGLCILPRLENHKTEPKILIMIRFINNQLLISEDGKVPKN